MKLSQKHKSNSSSSSPTIRCDNKKIESFNGDSNGSNLTCCEICEKRDFANEAELMSHKKLIHNVKLSPHGKVSLHAAEYFIEYEVSFWTHLFPSKKSRTYLYWTYWKVWKSWHAISITSHPLEKSKNQSIKFYGSNQIQLELFNRISSQNEEKIQCCHFSFKIFSRLVNRYLGLNFFQKRHLINQSNTNM